MKLSLLRRRRQDGFTYFTVIWISMLIALVTAAYLKMVSVQHQMTARSQAWNASIAVIEAGVEEALAHLNAHGHTNLGCEGWTYSSGAYTMQRDVGNNYYIVSVTPDLSPIIVSQGYVQVPLTVASRANIFLAAVGDEPNVTRNFIKRTVRVTTRKDGAFIKALTTRDNIDMNGNNVLTDSFDSMDPLFSTSGRYDVLKRKDNGDIASNSTVTNSLSLGNANIYGRVSTGPRGSVSVGANGAVGDKLWQVANTGIKPGWFTDDMNVSFPDVHPPFAGGAWTPNSGNYNGYSYRYLLNSGNYQMSSLSLSGQKDMIVTGNAVLYVTGNVSLSGTADITIVPGASLTMYVSGASADFSGGGIINQAGNATNFFYYGLPSNTSVKLAGNAEIVGVIYAPSASLEMKGGGSGNNDFIGAAVARKATMTGHFKLHYDEALGRYGPKRPFVITSWNEI